VQELGHDMRRVKADLYGPPGRGLVREFRDDRAAEDAIRRRQHSANRKLMLLVACVPVAIEVLKLIGVLPK